MISPRLRNLALLWALYFVQGLPFGFQATAVPTLLRERGASLTAVGLSSALAAPWLFKPLWAPLVDRYHVASWGRRRSWMLPMQLALALSALVAALSVESLTPLLAMVLVMNLFAATLDISVDGLAVDLLRERDLGHGNAAQVVGYKLGMLTGGGLLLWLSGSIGLDGLFAAMASLVMVVFVFTLRFDERAAQREANSEAQRAASEVVGAEPPRLAEVLRTLWRSFREPRAAWLLVIVGSYKIGESMADVMFKPFVIDAGFSKEQVGLWVGSWGMAFSMAGSLAGGLLASRWPLLRALVMTGVLRVIPLAGQWWLSLAPTVASRDVVVVTCAEHLCGGALTTVMFALMMSRVDRRIGATHFTVLAAVEVLGKTPAGWLSGMVAEAIGYAGVFAAATLASIAFVPLLALLKQRPSRSPAG